MIPCFFISDLHGQIDRYRKLFSAIKTERPAAVFFGGDLLPSGLHALTASTMGRRDFINDFLALEFLKLLQELKDAYPRVLLILGNDDPRFQEAAILDAGVKGIWQYIHNRKVKLGNYAVYGYAFVPPSPFQLKDWERYDVSRFIDPGCISPEEGYRSLPAAAHEIRYATIERDLQLLAGKDDLARAVLLFHSPPYQTCLDRAALDGKMIDHAPLDVHIGSIAIKRFIKNRQPLITLHGHVHESARLTGSWREQIGRTWAFSAAHDGPELALVRFDLENPEKATRQLI